MSKRINQTSAATFTDDPAGTLRYAAMEPAWDITYLANHIEVNSPDGTRGRTGSGIAVDAASTTDYGVIVKSVDSALENGGDRQALADYQLQRYAQPLLRLPDIELMPQINPGTAWPAVFGLEISSAVTVKRFDGLTSPMSMELNVEGMRLRGSPDGLAVSLRTSPRDTNTYWQLEDATLGTIETGNLVAP